MIINSLLDTDIYKYSMMQAVLHQFPSAEVEYRFKCRNEGIDLRPIRDDLQRELEHLCSLMLSHDELEYLSSLRYMKPDFIEFLRLFHLQSRFVHISEQDEQDRKSTRLNSSHVAISYAVFCLKRKNND